MGKQSRRHVLRAVCTIGAAGTIGRARAQQTNGYDTIRVPEDHATIQEGVDAASAGDLVLVEPGTYTEEVSVSTPNVTIRGYDRNGVVLDGEYGGGNAITVRADGVALENLTARFYGGTAFYWAGVEGFRGSFLTASNNGYYGIYAYGSRNGRFEHSYASGHPDAGVYLGRNQPYEAVVDDVVAEHNAIGYSGTSTGADLTIQNSVWRYNKVGILPNTLDGYDSPQRSSRIVGNDVYGNNSEDAPALANPYPLVGMGIVLWGGSANVVEENRVRDHEFFGIVAQPQVVSPSDNVIRGNQVTESGLADLALGQPVGDGNQFSSNEFRTTLPAEIESDSGQGSAEVADTFEELERLVETDQFPSGDWRIQPLPGEQPTMPNPEAAPRRADKTTTWAAPQAQTDIVDED